MFPFFGKSADNRRMANRLDLIKKKMKKAKISGRGSTINHAFASALALFDEFDEERINNALEIVGQSPSEQLLCVYCGKKAEDADHLNGLVTNTKYTGNGHVIGNLVPSCKSCNNSKRQKPWRDWAEHRNVPQERINQIAKYASLAPPPVSEDKLKELYPDLMDAYARLRNLCKDTMRAADSVAKEIQRLERKRLAGEGFGNIADPDEA